MKLYEIKLPARVMCQCSDGSSYIDVDHLDGAYSFCRTANGNITHLASWAELEERLPGVYVLADKQHTKTVTPVAAIEVEP